MSNPDSVIIEDEGAEPEGQTPAQEQNGNAAAQPAPEAPKEDKAKRGTGYVDFDSLPKDIAEVIEPRFKRLYGNLKAVERDRDSQFEINRKLAEQLEELHSKVNQRDTGDTLSRLREAHKVALMSADYDKATEIMEQITDYKAQAKPTPRVEVPAPTREAVDLSPAEQRAIVSWQAATDENGQPLRPWANAAHPKFQSAMKMIGAVTDDPDFAGASITEVLAEVDKKMGSTAQRGRVASVLTSTPEAVSKAPRAVALTDPEKRVALRMFRDTGMAKTDDDAYNRYRSAKGNTSRAIVVED